MEEKHISTRSQGISTPIELQDNPESLLRGNTVLANNVSPAQQSDFRPNQHLQDSPPTEFPANKTPAQSATQKLAEMLRILHKEPAAQSPQSAPTFPEAFALQNNTTSPSIQDPLAKISPKEHATFLPDTPAAGMTHPTLTAHQSSTSNSGGHHTPPGVPPEYQALIRTLLAQLSQANAQISALVTAQVSNTSNKCTTRTPPTSPATGTMTTAPQTTLSQTHMICNGPMTLNPTYPLQHHLSRPNPRPNPFQKPLIHLQMHQPPPLSTTTPVACPQHLTIVPLTSSWTSSSLLLKPLKLSAKLTYKKTATKPTLFDKWITRTISAFAQDRHLKLFIQHTTHPRDHISSKILKAPETNGYLYTGLEHSFDTDLTDALNFNVTKAIAQDGIALWQQLVTKFFKDPQKITASDIMRLKDQYNSFSRESNQSLSSFALSYQTLERKLARYNAEHCIPSGQERTIKFIMACDLADKSRQIQLVSDILDNKAAPCWLEPDITYDELADKLSDLEKTSQFLKVKMGIQMKQMTIPVKSKRDKQSSTNYSGKPDPKKKTANDDLRKAFGNEIRENPTVDTLVKWKGKHKYCVFHPELKPGGPKKSHTFLYCNKVKDICIGADCEKVLSQARRDNYRRNRQ